MILAGLTLPRTSGMASALHTRHSRTKSSSADYSLFYYFVLWMTLVLLSLVFIFIHGIEYVNWPRLLPLSDIVHYDGPGFRSGNHGKGVGIPAFDSRYAGKIAAKTHKRSGSKLEEIEMGTKSRLD